MKLGSMKLGSMKLGSMKFKRVVLEKIIPVEESNSEAEYAQAYGKFMQAITEGEFGIENITIEDV